ncbi:hypothetical protein DLAC_00021 [Tieghemostelium lacteum]|uniref:FAD dependent oxidoreductase domain-containing protein n=1 Tax=Tieghemostelium lacteum TaxID=361077 RepID=A0A152A8X4_TIELA|nr:hypothetical protein DLAC_00021 [Tieghemostelium lacteum]|eukprot:KYR02581.1 hypothetical protein DLAC_00021 [Tieghemostelium lacteum]
MSNQYNNSVRRIQTISTHLSHQNSSDSKVLKSNDHTLYDICVIGGGITGTSTAYQLSKEGYKVLLLEQYKIGHDNGSSHGDGRIIRFSYPEDIYLELAKLAYPLWNDIENESGSKLIQITGGIDFGSHKSQALIDLINAYKKHNIKYQVMEYQEANERFPQFNFQKENLIVYQQDAGVVYATKAVQTIWELAKRFGAVALDDKKVDQIKVESPELVTIQTVDQCIYKSKKVVLSCGGWINEILLRSQLNLQIPVEASQEKVFYWSPKPETKNIDYSQYSNPVSIYYGEVDAFYSLPQIEIPGVKIGYHHSGNALSSMKENKTKVYPPEFVEKIKKFVEKYNPGLDHSKESHSLTCVYTNTSDYHFIIDKHPRHQNVIIASPCSGHGFKFGPAIGKVITQLIKHNKTSLSTFHEFSLSRFNKSTNKRISA